jgi:hypothetical protein
MTPGCCADCNVLSGAPHHITCGFSAELGPRGELVSTRMSPAPCEFCAEYYPLARYNQRHHTQNPECFAKVKRAQDRERWNNLPAEKKRNCHRARDSRRAAERAQKRALRETEKAFFRDVRKPFELAVCMAKKRHAWLRKLDRDDWEQTILLALYEAGIDPDKTDCINIHRMQTFVTRHLDRLQRNSGFRRTQYGIPTFIGIDDFSLVSLQNWAATWRNA